MATRLRLYHTNNNVYISHVLLVSWTIQGKKRIIIHMGGLQLLFKVVDNSVHIAGGFPLFDQQILNLN